MDLSKAFDKINHDLLIAKLNAFGGTSLKHLRDYMEELPTSVPQETVLGSLLFNIYLNYVLYN